jgi:hypothetical protein
MGLKPSDYALLAGMIGGPALSGLLAPDGQERQSFEGSGATDPRAVLGRNNDMLTRMMQAVTDRAATPISLPSAVVQQPGSYTGGGLPMPIGLVASDPALTNPSLLNRQGMGEFQALQDLMHSYGGGGSEAPYHGGPDDSTPDNPDYVDPGGYHDVNPPPGVPPRTAQPRRIGSGGGDSSSDQVSVTPGGARRRSATTAPELFAEGDLINPGADLQQALGSVQLLLESLRA